MRQHTHAYTLWRNPSPQSVNRLFINRLFNGQAYTAARRLLELRQHQDSFQGSGGSSEGSIRPTRAVAPKLTDNLTVGYCDGYRERVSWYFMPC